MSYTVSLTRNPNLSVPKIDHSLKNEVQAAFGQQWWTGLAPEQCRGFNPQTQCLQALPLLNIQVCSREDILDYFNNTWTLTELLFAALKTEEAYKRSPYHQLRHPLIFYYGHPAVLFLNKLRLAGLYDRPVDLYLEKILETGVDEMSWDDMSKNEMEWPSVKAVHGYRKKVYNVVADLIKTHSDLNSDKIKTLGPQSPWWSLLMGLEHEKIHFETSSVLMRELPLELLEEPRYWVPSHPSAKLKRAVKPRAGVDYRSFEWLTILGQQVTYGKAPGIPSYGWDNEYGQRSKDLKDFQIGNQLVTNGEYFDFVASLAYCNDKYWSEEGLLWRKFRNTKRPTFWVASGPEGLHEYKLRTLFDVIDMPWDWPVEVNFHEAQAYMRWRQEQDKSNLHYRLITEPEHVLLRGDMQDVVLQRDHFTNPKETLREFPYNFNFHYSSPNPVSEMPANSKGIKDLFGNLWQWAEDQFNPLEGFKVHPYYDDFSTPCFDGKHQMILGGSFISCGHEASQWARFHFRPHFFQHAGFRIAATLDGSDDNGSTKLKLAAEYVHPRRNNVLEQINKPLWWKGPVEQPLDLNEGELKELWAQTEQVVLNFEKKRNSVSPMGSALDPATNDISKNFRLAYQSSKNFPERPEDYKKLLGIIFEDMAPTGQQVGHPGYMAYVAGAGNAITNLAQLISQTLNQFTGHFNMAPGLVTLEAEVIKWLVNMVQYPESRAGGFLTTGGSYANLSAMSLAKKAKLRGYDLSLGRFYVSTQAHHCIGKALSILGFPRESLVVVPVNEDLQMNVSELNRLIADDRAKKLQPICIVGTAGSTNTGAVDPLSEIAATAARENMWFHVDGAYGGLFMLTEKGQRALRGLELSDSVAMDPHKTLSLPYGTGCLLVRDKTQMVFEYAGASSYMPPSAGLQDESGIRMDFADISPELSRDFRGLRLWLPIKTLGIGPFKLNLEEKLALSEYLATEIKQIPELELVASPQLTIQAFKCKDSAKTRDLLTKINSRGELFLSGCQLNGAFVIRVCLLGFRSHFEQTQMLLSSLKECLKELRS